MTRPGERLLLDLPAGFAALRLDLGAPSLDAQARELVGTLRAAGRPVGDVEQTVRAITTVLDRFAALNVQLIGKFAVTTADGPATATVALAVHPLPVQDRDAAAANLSGLAGAVRTIVQRRHPDAELRVMPLPIGPTVVGVWLGRLRLPAVARQAVSIARSVRVPGAG